MKKSITILISFLSLFLINSGFSYMDNKSKSIKLNQNLNDSIIKDTIVVDTIDFNLVLFKEDAHASYYHDKFTGRKTASGAIFDNNKLTCAHKTLKFGTKLKVTSKSTGKSVKVVVNDRGPFTKGRDIDLSKKAFMKIAPKSYGGSIKVDIEIIKEE